MHKNNIHKDNYDFEAMLQTCQALKPFVVENQHQAPTVDFADPKAVKMLNRALLHHHYGIRFWEFPDRNLCPPIPGRADYIHQLAAHLKRHHLKDNIEILDIGTGATCIYPLLGNKIYDWKFVGSDIDKDSLNTARTIIINNDLQDVIKLRLQNDGMQILKGILEPTDRFTASMCNPPFFKSEVEALQATKTKLKGLGKEEAEVVRNFSGTVKELSYKGGEKAFVHNYLYESSQYKTQCFWFSCLVSKVGHVKSMQASLEKLGATNILVLDMVHGNKISRVVVWTFLTPAQQKEWIENQ